MAEPTLKEALRDFVLGLIPLISLVGGCYYVTSEIEKAANEPQASIVASKDPKSTNAKSSQLNSRSSSPTFEQRIEKEMARLDPWVKDWVQSDYTQCARFRPVSLRREPESLRQRQSLQGAMPSIASYQFYTNELLIPDKPELVAAGVSALPHELWHAVYDRKGVKGLLSSFYYKGPSSSQISKYAAQKAASKGRAALLTELKFQQWSFGVEERSQNLGEKIGMMGLIDSFVRPILKEAAFSRMYLLKYASPDDCRLVLKSLKDLQLLETDEYLRNFMSFGNSFAKANTPDARDKAVRSAQLAFDQVEADYASALCRFRSTKKMLRVLDNVEDRLLRRAKRSSSELSSFDNELRCLERSARYARLDFGHEGSSKCDSMMASNLEACKGSRGNSLEVKKIISEPDEIMARVVESLYRLYSGPFTQNEYPLDRHDLDFLDRFTYRGERVFGKGVDRYRTFLSLLEKKVPVDAARAKAYRSVPEIQFKIEGIIPSYEHPNL